MRIKQSIVIISALLTLGVNAKEVEEGHEIGVYGKSSYDFSDYETVTDIEKFRNSYFGIYNHYQFKDDYTLFLDVGASNSVDFMNDLSWNANGFDFNINKAFIRYQDSEDIYFDFGRMFTPVGFYNEDPLNYNNILTTTNSLLRYTDAIKGSYDKDFNDYKLKIDVFGGLNLNEDSVSSSNYGFNTVLGTESYGYLNLGALIANVDGELYLSGNPTDEIEVLNNYTVGYLYDNNNIEALISYNNIFADDLLSHEVTKVKLGYSIEQYTPFLYVENLVFSFDEDDSSNHFLNENLIYGGGLKIELNQFANIVGTVYNSETDVDYNSGETDLSYNETIYKAELNFRF